jgi:hypothetical protein
MQAEKEIISGLLPFAVCIKLHAETTFVNMAALGKERVNYR